MREGCIYEIKLVALVLKHISSKYSPTSEIWTLLLRGQRPVAMDIFLWNFSCYQDMLPYITHVCKPHSHTPYRCLKIDNFLETCFNVQIWSTDWGSNSGNLEYSFLVAKFLKHCYFQAMFAQI